MTREYRCRECGSVTKKKPKRTYPSMGGMYTVGKHIQILTFQSPQSLELACTCSAKRADNHCVHTRALVEGFKSDWYRRRTKIVLMKR